MSYADQLRSVESYTIEGDYIILTWGPYTTMMLYTDYLTIVNGS